MTTEEKYTLSTYNDVLLISKSQSKEIYLVKDEATDTLYVKKVLTGVENFDFYSTLTLLKHRNLVRIHHVIKTDDKVYFIEEYINGQTLKTTLEQQGVLTESRVIEYVSQVCDGLAYLHGQNPPVIHRDIKPENIICSTDGEIKLIDFDISREYKRSANRDTSFMGTKEYAAPEQYGYKQTDSRTDIYSVGVLIHELLTGKLPENNITYKGTLRKVIDKCLKIDPNQRYRSITELKKDLTSEKGLSMRVTGLSAVALLLIGFAGFYLFNSDRFTDKDKLPPATETATPAHSPLTSEETSPTPSPLMLETEQPIQTPESTPVNYSDIELINKEMDFYYFNVVLAKLQEKYPPDPLTLEEMSSIFRYKVVNDMIKSIANPLYDLIAEAFLTFDDFYPAAVFFDYSDGISFNIYGGSDEQGKELFFEMVNEELSITYFDYASNKYYPFTNGGSGSLEFLVKSAPTDSTIIVYDTPVLSADDISGTYINATMTMEVIVENGGLTLVHQGIREPLNPLEHNNYTFSYGDTTKELQHVLFTEDYMYISTIPDVGVGLYGVYYKE